ncbi:hypothetical protein GQ53DRAFT_750810 [Thozetella sp. PMI_491]|nr:hypothetical protein GQ53DRAFT_750810 [Thozetella sp. PMI_491]
MASEAASLAASSVQASASSAVASAIMMANSASSSASSALAAASVAMAEATSVRAQADTQVQQAQGSAVSVTQAAIAVVGAIIVSALLTLAGFYLFIRYRKTKLKEQEEENFAHEQANAALDRAVLSYMGKGSSYGPYSEYAPSEAGDRARSVMMNRPNTADKSAIPGMGVFSLALRDPAKPPSKGQPLDKVEEVAPEAPKAEKVDEKGERVTSEEWNSRRASNWPFARQP